MSVFNLEPGQNGPGSKFPGLLDWSTLMSSDNKNSVDCSRVTLVNYSIRALAFYKLKGGDMKHIVLWTEV
jgi:hypothetical protein